ncbi:hypothetical protein [Caballeronia insecticola]|uniref:hypothetical protein n=1 Tax=Caballeronia insecticola TaxID=758793 RepID=UPI0011828265
MPAAAEGWSIRRSPSIRGAGAVDPVDVAAKQSIGQAHAVLGRATFAHSCNVTNRMHQARRSSADLVHLHFLREPDHLGMLLHGRPLAVQSFPRVDAIQTHVVTQLHRHLGEQWIRAEESDEHFTFLRVRRAPPPSSRAISCKEARAASWSIRIMSRAPATA